MAEALDVASPVMGGAAGLDQDSGRRLKGEEAKELRPAHASALGDMAGVAGESDLEDGLCDIDGDGCIVHGGLLPGTWSKRPIATLAR